MAYEFYVTVKGAKQGLFKQESLREKHKDKIPGVSFHYSVSSPRDAATGQASGKRTHQPVTFVKEWGAATPQLFQALCTNEVLSEVLFEFVRTDANGEELVYHTVKLVNATVSEIEQYVAEDEEQEAHDVRELEEISFTFQRIEIESKVGKTMAMDDWMQRR